MKKCLLIVIFELFSLMISAQIAYYDAINLNMLIDGNSGKFYPFDSARGKEVYQIYSNYMKGELNPEAISVAIENNPFLKEYFPGFGGAASMPDLTKSGISMSGLIKGVGSMDVTNIADGLAQFMVERAKEELNVAFFEKFKEKMEDPMYSDLKLIFPETFNALKQIDTKIYHLNNFIQALRETMNHDLRDLLKNSQNLIYQEKYQKYFELNPGINLVVKSGLLTANALQNGKHPYELIDILASKHFGNDTLSQNFTASMRVLNLFSKSILDSSNADSAVWIEPFSMFHNVINNERVLRFYLGLIYQQLANENSDIKWQLRNSKVISFKTVLDTIAANYSTKIIPIKNYLSQVTGRAATIDECIKRRKNGDTTSYSGMRIYNASIDLIESVTMLPKFGDDALNSLSNELSLSRYISIARLGGKIVFNVESKEYASAIISLTTLLDTIFIIKVEINTLLNASLSKLSRPDRREFDRKFNDFINNPYDVAIQEDIHAFIKQKITDPAIAAELNKLLNSSIGLHNYNIIKAIVKYGTFGANLVNADSPETVKAVLEASALPVGSYRIKRQSGFSIALNGFLGVSGGVQKEKEGNSTVIGPWAPIGPSFNFGNMCSRKKHSPSISIFVPLIDIGAIALFRVNDDTTQLEEKVEFNEIISPGIFLSYGFARAPINISGGYQMAPILQSIETGQPVIGDKYGRIVLTVSVDLPLMNIYSSTKDLETRFKVKKVRKKKEWYIN